MAEVVRLELQLAVGTLSVADIEQSLSETVVNYQILSVTTGSTDIALAFGAVTTADILYIYSNQQISYKLNSSATAITVDADKPHLLYGTSVTALTYTNASGSTATIRILLAGA